LKVFVVCESKRYVGHELLAKLVFEWDQIFWTSLRLRPDIKLRFKRWDTVANAQSCKSFSVLVCNAVKRTIILVSFKNIHLNSGQIKI